MSDILQAAKWMKDGKSVRCASRNGAIYSQLETGAFFTDSGGIRTYLDLDDLLDTTWEEAQ